MGVNTKIIKYKGQNVGQCWNCTNCVGHTISGTIPGGLSYPEKKFALPECKVEDLYMTHVNRDPCPYFDKRSKEFHILGE